LNLSPHDDILAKVSDYFVAKLAEYGPTAPGVDWNESSVIPRNRQFLRLFGEERNATILDLGCGYGDFLRFMREQGLAGTYIGYDILPEMIAAARRIHGEGDDRIWRVGALPQETADYAVASGILNRKGDVSIEDWREYVRETVDVLARAGRRGFAFNMLTLSSDPERRRPDLYYADPVEMSDYCLSRFGRSLALLQDYGLYEFTIVVRQTRVAG
jgi:SAM-dependent methyltransferase